MSLFSVPQDILDEILEDLTAQQVLNLAGASRYFYEVTMPRWAASAKLTSSDRITCFCSFMLNNSNQHRPLLLRQIIMLHTATPISAEDLLLVTRVINKAVGLQTFEDNNIAHSLSVCSPLIDALRTRPNLMHLKMLCMSPIWDAQSPPAHLLATMTARLRTLKLWTAAPFPDLTHALKPHANTLYSFKFSCGENPRSTAPFYGVICPGVSELSLACTSCQVLEVATRAFPNVETLMWDVERCSDGPDHHSNAFQRWEKLTYVIWRSRWPLPLSRPVRRIMLKQRASDAVGPAGQLLWNPLGFDHILRVLLDTKPKVLDIGLDVNLVGALLPHLASDVKYLRLHGSAKYCLHGEASPPEELDLDVRRVGELLNSTKVTGVVFVFHASLPDILPLRRALGPQKLLELATSIARLVHSLTSVGVETTSVLEGRRDRYIPSWFNVIREQEAFSHVEPLSLGEGVEIDKRLFALP